MDRVTNEQIASDEGSVYVEQAKLKGRFSHVNGCPNARRARAFLDGWIAKSIKGSVVLDLGCYDGRLTKGYAALGPKRLVGIDISPVAIEAAKSAVNAELYVMDAHRMTFPDNTFDAVIGIAILHHLDFETAIKEIRRVLKPGGYAIFHEPLRDNPAAKLLRFLTPAARTTDELPLSRKQIEFADRFFTDCHHGFFGFTSTGMALLTSLLWRSNPDNLILKAADCVDKWIASTPMRYWMRTVELVWRK